MKLTKHIIEKLTCPKGRDRLVFDDACRGLAIRVMASGAKSFLFQYRHGRSIRRLRIGSAADVSLAQARTIADAKRGEVAAGGDPVATKKAATAMAAKKAAADALTFATLTAVWGERALKDRSDRYRGEALRALRVNFAPFAARPAAEITATEVQSEVDSIGHLSGLPMARRSRAYARAMYGWAMKRQLVMRNPFTTIAIEGREVVGERVLSDIEIGEVWLAAGALGWPFGPFIRLLLLTLQREAETAGMQWSELAKDGRSWEVPSDRAKNRRPHLVHLAPLARQVLAGVPHIEGCKFVFSTTLTSPISGFSRAKLRLDAEIAKLRTSAAVGSGEDNQPAPLEPWRFHDLRRTGVTALVRRGVQIQVADRLLNHVTGAMGAVARIYQKYDFAAEREAALELWAAHVEQAAAAVAAAAAKGTIEIEKPQS